MYVGDRDTFNDVFCQDCGRIASRETLTVDGLCEDCQPKETLHYRQNQSRKTTADVFFANNDRKNLRDCEAWVNADGTLHEIMIDRVFYKTNELAAKGITAVDFYVKTTLYIS